MTSCRHHSGYLADDEAGHTMYLARVQPPKKPVFSKMGQASKLGHMPPPPSMCGPSGNSGLRSHHRKLRGPQPFGSFLDFLVEGQVLDSLQRVVEEATERMATMKTESGLPLVGVQDPVEVLMGRRRVRARPSLSTVHQHRVQPSLCTGHPNNYPSCSSSTSDSRTSITAGCLGSHSRGSDQGYCGSGPLPPTRDQLLQEKSLKRLLQLENRGKSLGQSCSQGDSLPWDSLGSSLGTPEASELGPAERELIFLKRELNKEIKSLLSQPESFDLPHYSSLQEPHQTLDFLAKHQLFPALQNVVSQAVEKLRGARCHNGCPLFPSEWEPSTEPKQAMCNEDEEPCCHSLRTSASNFKVVERKSTKSRGQGNPKEVGSSTSHVQGAARCRPQVIPTEEPKVLLPQPRQAAPDQDPKKQKPPMFSSGPRKSSQKARPWRKLHLSLPTAGIKVEVPSQTHLTQSTNYKSMKKTLPPISPKSMSYLSNPWHEELVNYLIEQAVSLLICKYKFERNLTKQLGFISFPITETLVDLSLGFKKVKGSQICLSSNVDSSSLLRQLEEAQWAKQMSQPVSLWASQHNTSRGTASRQCATHCDTSQHSREPVCILPKPDMVIDRKVAQEPSLHTELPGPRLPTPLQNSTAKERERRNLLKPKASTSNNSGVSSQQSKQTVDTGESQSLEEDEEDKEYKFGGDENRTQSHSSRDQPLRREP